MSNLEMIEALCDLVMEQNAIIRAQAEALHQLGTVCMEEEREKAQAAFGRFVGGGDPPFEL